ncbi:E3 SUMO-protein ligase ZBED1-like [Wyeomyia smithii]|uniref:E3 SUMO-protein ligase ZBED1-like n=1 Tax=Wyeomyia smithii TaxID=174621 RepID=UPI002467B627|nr:E3 SUMO-protein ligase ZBED1-like [Wyeomyia smithii]
MLSGSDLSAAIEGRNIFQPIMHVITELESEKKSLAGKVIPLLSMMKTVLESFNSKTECVKQLKSALLDQFNSRFQHIELVDGLAIATLLDPRFKALHLQPISHANAVTMVSEKLKYFEREERGRRCASTKIVDNVSSQLNNDDENLWKIHDRLVVERTASMEHDKPGNISSELRNFLHQQVIPRNSDPLEAWDTIKTEYPNLYFIASDYLSRMNRLCVGFLVQAAEFIGSFDLDSKSVLRYDETYAPVVRYTSLRYLFALAIRHDLVIDQMDALTVFLQGDLDEEIYMEQPPCFTDDN